MAGCPQLLVIIALVTCLGAQAAPSVPQLLPVDEAPRRPDFLAFRQELQAIVERRDVAALLKTLDPRIRTDFGGGEGTEDFKKTWKLDRVESELWKELGWVLAHGGTFAEGNLFQAPYLSSRWPEQFDAFEYVALTGSRVRIREARSEDAAVLATLSYAILQYQGTGYPRGPWMAVKLPDGRAGFVAWHLARSPVQYRAVFQHVGGRWRMSAFVAGD